MCVIIFVGRNTVEIWVIRFTFVFFSSGAYGTTLTPDSGKKALAKNNYDGAGGLAQEKIAEGKLDYVYKVEIPKDEVTREKAGGRNVLRYEGDLNLKDYPHTIHKVPDTKTNKSSKWKILDNEEKKIA